MTEIERLRHALDRTANEIQKVVLLAAYAQRAALANADDLKEIIGALALAKLAIEECRPSGEKGGA